MLRCDPDAKSRKDADLGFFMCDETLERIQDQCRAFIQNPDSNYMLEIFSQKLKAYGKLSEKGQEQLNLTHKQILKEKVLPAYQTLIEGLEQLRGTGKNTGGLSTSRIISPVSLTHKSAAANIKSELSSIMTGSCLIDS